MKKISILFLLILLVGCGKIAQESGSSGDDSPPPAPPAATYTISATVSPNVAYGTIEKSPSQSAYSSDTQVQLSAVANSGYTFDHWEGGDLTGTAGVQSVTMNANKSVTAVFRTATATQYSLTISTSGSGSVSKTPDASNYTDGTNVVLQAIPASEWEFSHWSGDISGTSANASVNMNGNKNITAVFVKEWISKKELNENISQYKLKIIDNGDVYALIKKSDGQISLYLLNGDNWSQIGGIIDSSSEAYIGSFLVVNSNEIYVSLSFCSGSAYGEGKSKIVKWNGSNWVSLGYIPDPWTQICVSPMGQVYVAYVFTVSNEGVFNDDSQGITIRKFDGSDWNKIAPSALLDGLSPFYTSSYLVVSDSEIYALASHDLHNYTMLKWNGTTWSKTGNTITYTDSMLNMRNIRIVSNTEIYAKHTADGDNYLIWRWNGSSWASSTLPHTKIGDYFPVRDIYTGENVSYVLYSDMLNVDYPDVYDSSTWKTYEILKKWDGSQWSNFGSKIKRAYGAISDTKLSIHLANIYFSYIQNGVLNIQYIKL